MIKLRYALLAAIILLIINSVQIILLIYASVNSQKYIDTYRQGYVLQQCKILNYTRESLAPQFNHLIITAQIVEQYNITKFAAEPDFTRIDEYIKDNPPGSYVQCKYFVGYDLQYKLIFDNYNPQDRPVVVIDDENFNNIKNLYYILLMFALMMIITVVAQLLTWRAVQREYLTGLITVEK
jgi:hypothetical protein